MEFKLRPYQQEAVDAALKTLRSTPEPTIIEASVGAGKSLLCAEIMRVIENAGKRALCLTMTSELISQNAEKYSAMGGEPSIFCASLGKKAYRRPCVFASPQSLWSAIKAKHKVADADFALIVIDEAHNVAANPNTTYQKIFAHYYARNPRLRILGMTGTPFRDGDVSIVGKEAFFKSTCYSVDMPTLIEWGFLVKPVFGAHAVGSIDYSAVSKQCRASEMERALIGQGRLTSEICHEIVDICRPRGGCFIFAATVQHCDEVMESLPPDISAVVTGKTPDKQRMQIMADARAGKIKYLVNVNCLTTGVDLPHFDTVAWLRPTGSLNLYLQGIGRGVRLSDSKTECLVLDYAGNIDRHGDIDNPVINDATKWEPTGDKALELDCPVCNTANPLTARRCCGSQYIPELDKVGRCTHFFSFVLCRHCEAQNDVASKYCRICEGELLDPNERLQRAAAGGEAVWADVYKGSYSKHNGPSGATLRCDYILHCPALGNPTVSEWFRPNTHRYMQHFALAIDPSNDFLQTASIDDLVKASAHIPKPVRVKVQKSGRYFNVLEKEFSREISEVA